MTSEVKDNNSKGALLLKDVVKNIPLHSIRSNVLLKLGETTNRISEKNYIFPKNTWMLDIDLLWINRSLSDDLGLLPANDLDISEFDKASIVNEVEEEIMIVSNVLIGFGYKPINGQVKKLNISFRSLVYQTWQAIAMPIRFKNDKVYLIQVLDGERPEMIYQLISIEKYIESTAFDYSSLYKKIKSIKKEVAILRTLIALAAFYLFFGLFL